MDLAVVAPFHISQLGADDDSWGGEGEGEGGRRGSATQHEGTVVVAAAVFERKKENREEERS